MFCVIGYTFERNEWGFASEKDRKFKILKESH